MFPTAFLPTSRSRSSPCCPYQRLSVNGQSELAWPLTTFDTMLDADSVAMNPRPDWVERNQRFTDRLAGEKNQNSQQKRHSIDAFFIADTQTEIAEEAFRSGITPDEMS